MSLMQCRRAAEGVDGGGETADGRTDQLLDDLMEDLNNASSGTAAVRSVRVVEGSAQAQPEGGAQEVVVAGAGGPQPGHNGGAQGVMEGLSPDQQAVLRQAAEVLRTGCSCSGRLVRRLLWWMQEGDLNIFQGANNKLNELEAWIQVKANEAIKELKGLVTEVFWVLLHFLPAAWSHWCFDLKASLLLHKVILWFWVPLDRMEVLNNKGTGATCWTSTWFWSTSSASF